MNKGERREMKTRVELESGHEKVARKVGGIRNGIKGNYLCALFERVSGAKFF